MKLVLGREAGWGGMGRLEGLGFGGRKPIGGTALSCIWFFKLRYVTV